MLSLPTIQIQMQKLNLRKLIDDLKLDESEIASILFPENTHPKLSLKRIIDGKSELHEAHILALCKCTNMSMVELYSQTGFSPVFEGSELVFYYKHYKGTLYVDRNVIVVVKDVTEIDRIMINSMSTIKELINFLNTKLSQYE